MKKSDFQSHIAISGLVCALVLLCAQPQALAAKDKTVTVLSESTIEAQPDLAIITFHFSAYGWTVDRSRKKVDRIIKKFFIKLSEKGVKETKVRIGDTKLKPSYQFNRELKTHVPSDFLISRQVSIHLEDLSMVSKIMDASLSIGSFLLETALLTVKDKPALEGKAFIQAIEDGKVKARGIAESLGMELGEVLSVKEIRSEIEDLNLIQGTGFAQLAAKHLDKKESKGNDENGKESKISSEFPTENGHGFFALPDGEEIEAFMSKSLPQTTWIEARSKLEITFLLK